MIKKSGERIRMAKNENKMSKKRLKNFVYTFLAGTGILLYFSFSISTLQGCL